MIPATFHWDGEVMKPMGRFAKVCDQQFVVGENYTLEAVQPRSSESHRHYFACITEAWQNLNEDAADEFPTSEHLRAWGLVKAGFADKRVIKCATSSDAIECAAAVKSGEKILIIDVSGKVVTVWTPHSQSMRSMGKAKFSESKSKVLDAIASMVGVSANELTKHAGRAA